jgi:ribA/ribD-fused uncharacterized protein
MSTEPIDRFTGEWAGLSNFARWPSGRTLEHVYQAAKAVKESDVAKILKAPTAGEAKALGRRIQIRPDWEEKKVGFMLFFLRRKFGTIRQFRALLLSTGDRELIEGNHWGDTFWGVCNGVGENMLGKLLMQVRGELRDEEAEAGPGMGRLDHDQLHPQGSRRDGSAPGLVGG